MGKKNKKRKNLKVSFDEGGLFGEGTSNKKEGGLFDDDDADLFGSSKSKDENKNNDSSILPSIDLTKDETSEDEFEDGLPPPPDDENESKDEEELPQSKKPKFGQQVLPTGLLAAMGNTKLKSADTGPSLFDSEEPDDSFLSTSSSTSTKNKIIIII